jgi:hypothetical protein
MESVGAGDLLSFRLIGGWAEGGTLLSLLGRPQFRSLSSVGVEID